MCALTFKRLNDKRQRAPLIPYDTILMNKRCLGLGTTTDVVSFNTILKKRKAAGSV